MQPYLFPYLGYYNLASASDIFVFYDDVNYIKRGWINRNNILVNGQANKFSVPLSEVSQNKLIKDTNIQNYDEFKEGFLKKIYLSYKKSKNFDFGYHYVENVLSSDFRSISDLASISVICLFEILDISKTFYFSSKKFSDTKSLGRTARLTTITKKLKSNRYINSLGGQEIYSKDDFKSEGVILEFCKPVTKQYKQHCSSKFLDNLSIIDLTMNIDEKDLPSFLDSYELI